MILQLFENNAARPVPLNVEHKKSRRSLISIGLPHTLSLGEISAVIRICQECSDARQAFFEGRLVDVFTPSGKMAPRFVARLLAWRRQEHHLLMELRGSLQPILRVPMIPVWRQ